MKSNPNSHLTAKERDRISLPARIIRERGWLAGKVLDFGCGFGMDVEELRKSGSAITGYDPHYFPQKPEEKFDTILCFYVLNVLLPEEQAAVLMEVSHLLKPGGKAYFAVRRDLQQEGYRMHRLHQKMTYQCLVKLPYKSVIHNENCEIYEYQHYSFLHRGNETVSPFFTGAEVRETLLETATAFAIWDGYPVSPGHTLVIPKRLVPDYFELSWKEQSACWMIVNQLKKIIAEMYQPKGFNVGINVSEAAGQTVAHAHIHLIPRYDGDVEERRGGVRGVIPQKRDYEPLY